MNIRKVTQITGQSLWTCIETEKHVLLLRKGLKIRPVMNSITLSWLTKIRIELSETESQEYVVQNLLNQYHGGENKDEKMNCGELDSGQRYSFRIFLCAFCVCDKTVWLKKLRDGQSLFSIQATVYHWGNREQELEAETILTGSAASSLLPYTGQDHLFREWCHPWWTLLTHQSR